jgi:hypothetical protein
MLIWRLSTRLRRSLEKPAGHAWRTFKRKMRESEPQAAFSNLQ